MYICLSHILNTRDRAFPGAPTMSIKQHEMIGEDGSPCNTYKIELFNHFGTHIDAPNHFNPNGKQLWELSIEQFIGEKPIIIDIKKGEGEGVLAEELLAYSDEIENADMLFIRTGFEAIRYSDNKCYSERGPYVSAAAAKLIVQKWSHLKAIGLDFISLSSPLNLPEGVKAHQTMLGMQGDSPVLIIEDVKMADIIGEKLEEVIVSPLLVEGIDSAPVTIMARMKK